MEPTEKLLAANGLTLSGDNMTQITTTPHQITITTADGLQLTYTPEELAVVVAKECEWLRVLLRAQWQYQRIGTEATESYQWLIDHKEFI